MEMPHAATPQATAVADGWCRDISLVELEAQPAWQDFAHRSTTTSVVERPLMGDRHDAFWLGSESAWHYSRTGLIIFAKMRLTFNIVQA